MKRTLFAVVLFMCFAFGVSPSYGQLCPYPADDCNLCPFVTIPPTAVTCPGGPLMITPSVFLPGGLTVKNWSWSDPTASPMSGTGTIPGLTTFTPPVSTTYFLSLTAKGPNIIADPTFSGWTALSSCFSSGYTLYSGAAMPSDNYAVGTDPALFSGLFLSMTDHTGDPVGNMLIANSGPLSPLTPVWQEVEIPVCPGKKYEFSAWYANLQVVATPADAPILRVKITGYPSGATLYSGPFSSLGGGTWNQLTTPAWAVGTDVFVTAQIFEENPSYTPVDFAIDDISLNRLCTVTHSMEVSMPSITGTTTICQNGATSALSSIPAGGTWTSGAPAVATVNLITGVVTGVTPGLATITYHSPLGCDVTTVVNVQPELPAIAGDADICSGDFTLYTNSVPGGTWSSSSSALVFYMGPTLGDAHADYSGTTTITYTLGACIATMNVNIHQTPGGGWVYLACEGGSLTLPMVPAGGTWTTSTPAIVGISGSTLTALAPGWGIITYTTPFGCSATSAVSVISCRNGGPGAMYGISLCQGSSADANSFLAAGVPTGGTWSAPSPSSVSITPGGIVTGTSGGTTIITYTVGGIPFWGPVVVTPMPTPGISITYAAPAPSTVNITGLPTGASASYSVYMPPGSSTSIGGGTYTEGTSPAVLLADIFTMAGCVCPVEICIESISYLTCTWPAHICTTVNSAPKPAAPELQETGSTNVLLTLAPNPNKGSFNLTGSMTADNNHTAAISISDALGRTVYTTTATIAGGKLDAPLTLPDGVANGIYLLRVKAEGLNKVLRFELQR